MEKQIFQDNYGNGGDAILEIKKDETWGPSIQLEYRQDYDCVVYTFENPKQIKDIIKALQIAMVEWEEELRVK